MRIHCLIFFIICFAEILTLSIKDNANEYEYQRIDFNENNTILKKAFDMIKLQFANMTGDIDISPIVLYKNNAKSEIINFFISAYDKTWDTISICHFIVYYTPYPSIISNKILVKMQTYLNGKSIPLSIHSKKYPYLLNYILNWGKQKDITISNISNISTYSNIEKNINIDIYIVKYKDNKIDGYSYIIISEDKKGERTIRKI